MIFKKNFRSSSDRLVYMSEKPKILVTILHFTQTALECNTIETSFRIKNISKLYMMVNHRLATLKL